MTYSVIRTATRGNQHEVYYDLIADNGDTIAGGLVTVFNSAPTDTDIAERMTEIINDYIVSITPGDETNDFVLMEKTKLKWDLLKFMRMNPEKTLDDAVASLDWAEEGLVVYLVKLYAIRANERGLTQATSDTAAGCYAILNGIVQASTDEQLKLILRDQ